MDDSKEGRDHRHGCRTLCASEFMIYMRTKLCGAHCFAMHASAAQLHDAANRGSILHHTLRPILATKTAFAIHVATVEAELVQLEIFILHGQEKRKFAKRAFPIGRKSILIAPLILGVNHRAYKDLLQ